MITTVAFLSPHRHPRLRYVLRELSRDTGYQFRLFTDSSKWTNTQAEARINYGGHDVDLPSLYLTAHPFLSGKHPAAEDLVVSQLNNRPVFFSTPTGPDYLSCIFYMLSRYEEYQPFQADGHDRFPASESHAFRNNYLHLPLVRMYTAFLVEELGKLFPDLAPPQEHPFYVQPTYDIDMLWAYRYRGLKGIASGIRDIATGQADRARERFLDDDSADPYFNLDYLLNLHPDTRPFIFWLLADNDCREDVNPYPVPDEQKAAMKALASEATHGIHPGYSSTNTEGKLRSEVNRFRNIFGLIPQHSRQHFLRLRLPETYRALRQNGVTNDHSMGYGDATGWRAGTNLPFRWYDLDQETMTGLTIHPFAVMDVTLKNYLKLSPQEASAHLAHLRAATEPCGGPFTLLWHNSSFADAHGWAGWRTVYEEVLI